MPIKEKFFHIMTDNAMVGVYIIDKKLMWRYVNDALAAMLGYTPEEMLGMVGLDSVIHPDEIPQMVRNSQQRLSGEVPSAHYETRALHKSGHVVNIEIFANLINYKGQRALAGTVIDITARIAAEKQLHEQRQELEMLNRTLEQRVAEALAVSREKDQVVMQQSRFVAMGEMVAGIAHQWRQPLNMLGMSVQALQLAHTKGKLTDEIMERHSLKSLEVLKSMSHTIDDFRNFFRPENDPQCFRLDDVVERVVSFFNSNANGIAITTDVRSQSIVCGHMNELSQVVLCILNNARDALLERHVAGPIILVTVIRDNNMNLIKVSDNAGGIPEQVIGRIFDPFFSTKDALNGTGLGLYMVKSIVEKSMKGTVTVKNTATGAEFSILLPLH